MLSYGLLSLASKWDLSPPLIWGSLWVLHISRWWCGTEWKRGCGRDLPCGRSSSFIKEEESLLFEALWRVCQPIVLKGAPKARLGSGRRDATLRRLA
ncbi:hypothetical protein CK203_015496 [Vitis vinifera]|uniref:Uncharacterized protein n=1 Tax=Vitis vinifera TaxID=29760 RepID=A0A438J5F1_VITVI|nr:hypothetical protein CK203_015496 [Vitis vinifera]